MSEELLTDPLQGQCHRCGQPGETGSPCPEPGCFGALRVPTSYAKAQQGHTHPKSLVGRQIGEFLVVRPLGKGGFGSVYLALKRPTYRTQGALKLFDPSHTSEELAPTLRRYFLREIKILSTLNEPNIIQLMDEGEHEGCPYFVMRYVGGGQILRSFMRREQPCEPSFVGLVIVQILRALKAAHTLGVVHRDLKPENIMLQGEDHHVYVLDFGLAKHVQEENQTTATFGTPYYMSPEQLFPTREELRDYDLLDSRPFLSDLSEPSVDRHIKVGPASDLYAVGVLVAEMMTGRALFESQATGELGVEKDRRRFDPAQPLRELELPEPIYDFLNKAMAYRPVDRYRSADEFRQAFEHALEHYSAHCEANPDYAKPQPQAPAHDMSSVAFLSTHGEPSKETAPTAVVGLRQPDKIAQLALAPTQAAATPPIPSGPPPAQLPAQLRSDKVPSTELNEPISAPLKESKPSLADGEDALPSSKEEGEGEEDANDADSAADEPIYQYTSPRRYVVFGVILTLITALITYIIARPEPAPPTPVGPTITDYDRELARVRARAERLPRLLERGEYERLINVVRELDKSEARLTPEEHKRVAGLLKQAQRELPHQRQLEQARQHFEHNDPDATLGALEKIPVTSAVYQTTDRRQLSTAAVDMLMRRAYNDLLLRRDEEMARQSLQALLRHEPNHQEALALLDKLNGGQLRFQVPQADADMDHHDMPAAIGAPLEPAARLEHEGH